MTSSLATRKKSTGTTAARRKSTGSSTTRRKSTSSTTTRRRPAKSSTASASSGGLSSLKRPRSTRRSSTTTTTSRRASLTTDLKKYVDEEYTSTELTHGALIMVQREGMDAVRTALLALLGGNIPLFGSGLSDNAVDSLVSQLADDYKKLAADERKALRAVLLWLSGKFEVDEETKNNLLATFTNTTQQR